MADNIKNCVQEFNISSLDFGKEGLIPTIAQCAESGQVLMQAWMNKEALMATLRSGKVTYWSRSRKRLWVKGESSGHSQKLCSIYADCDGDSLLLQVKQTGPACHTGAQSCFFNKLKSTQS